MELEQKMMDEPSMGADVALREHRHSSADSIIHSQGRVPTKQSSPCSWIMAVASLWRPTTDDGIHGLRRYKDKQQTQLRDVQPPSLTSSKTYVYWPCM